MNKLYELEPNLNQDVIGSIFRERAGILAKPDNIRHLRERHLGAVVERGSLDTPGNFSRFFRAIRTIDRSELRMFISTTNGVLDGFATIQPDLGLSRCRLPLPRGVGKIIPALFEQLDTLTDSACNVSGYVDVTMPDVQERLTEMFKTLRGYTPETATWTLAPAHNFSDLHAALCAAGFAQNTNYPPARYEEGETLPHHVTPVQALYVAKPLQSNKA